MTAYADWAVLLKTYGKLPFLKLGKPVTDVIGGHIDVVNVRLRHQQGIIWEKLEVEKARAVGSMLDSEGFPTLVVPQSKVANLGNMTLLRKGEVTETGLMLNDWFGKKNLIPGDTIKLAQVGWIGWMVEAGQGVPGLLSSDSRLFSHFEGLYRMANLSRAGLPSEAMGWVLQLFPSDAESTWIRIFGRSFNYSYQATSVGGWEQHFERFLSDLAKVLNPEAIDEGMKKSLGPIEEPPEEAKYGSLHEMVDRARWELTIRSL